MERARPAGRLLWALAGSCHPGPVAAVTTVTALYARAVGRGRAGTLAATSAVLAGHLALGWQNDALDRSIDAASGRSDKPAARGDIDAATLRRAASIAGGACVPLSLLSGPRAGAAHLVAVGSGLAYNLRLKATPASIAPYVVSFGLLPAFITLGGPDRRRPPWWAVAAAALLGAGAHPVNALPDLEADRAAGIVGLPHLLGRDGSLALSGACLLAATGVLTLAGPGPATRRVAAAAASLCLVGASLRTGARKAHSRGPFAIVLVMALLDVTLLLAASRAGS